MAANIHSSHSASRMLLQLSSGHGPLECQIAVKHALREIVKEADAAALSVHVLDETPSEHGFHSVLLAVEGPQCATFAATWAGTIQWNCPSPVRRGHARKNWFIGVQQLVIPPALPDDGTIVFSTCRSSGKGGQHVNKTESAVHAHHLASGIRVKVQTERSQFANKRLAKEWIAIKLLELQTNAARDQKKNTNDLHWQIERGNPVRVFRGPHFQSDN